MIAELEEWQWEEIKYTSCDYENKVFQFNNSVKVELREEEAKMTPKALGIMYETMLMLPPKIQNIKKKKTCFGRQSNGYSFECIIYDITKEYPDGHTIQLEIWLDFRREVFTSSSSPLYTSIPVQQCTIFISIVSDRNPVQINVEKIIFHSCTIWGYF